MRVFGLLMFLLSLPLLASTEITTQIHDIDYGTRPGDDVLVLLTSGHVAKLRHADKSLFGEQLSIHPSKKKWFRFLLDDGRYIKNMTPTSAPFTLKKILSRAKAPESEKLFQDTPGYPGEYVPSTLPNLAMAKKFFSEQRYNPKESQCFNRAMVWTYEWWKKHSFKSNKVLIFFSRTFIRRFDFDWWFHISPLIHAVDENGKVVERVMDRKYTSGPLEMLKWAKIFLRGIDSSTCPIITKFSEYADYPYTGNCMLIRTHMYTYQPADLQMYEAWGYTKDSFHLDEVAGAYKEAFDETPSL